VSDTLTMDDLRNRVTVNVWPEAGKVLGLSKNTTYAAAKRGDIPTLRIGGRIVVPVARLLAMLEGEAVTDAVA
jgi:excisionase family DNA binding protein